MTISKKAFRDVKTQLKQKNDKKSCFEPFFLDFCSRNLI